MRQSHTTSMGKKYAELDEYQGVTELLCSMLKCIVCVMLFLHNPWDNNQQSAIPVKRLLLLFTVAWHLRLP